MRSTTQKPARLIDRPVPGGLLARLSQIDLRAIEQVACLCRVVRGQMFLGAGETAGHIALLYEGVALDRVQSDGHWIAAEILTGGDLAGEVAVLPGREPAHRIVADTDVTYALMSRSDFNALLHRRPYFAAAVVEHLARQRTHWAHSHVAASTHTARVRLARTLAHLHDIYNSVGWKPRGDIPIGRDDLGGLARVPRSRIPRLIGELAQAGFITANSAWVSIVDARGLRRL